MRWEEVLHRVKKKINMILTLNRKNAKLIVALYVGSDF